MTFTQNDVRGTYLVFQNRRFQGFISELLIAVSLLGEKLILSTSLGRPKFSGSFKFFVYIDLVLLINVSEQLEILFLLQISEKL